MFFLAQNLIGEMKRMNMNLPARVWIPFYKFPHHVVRIAYTESTVLNSRDRVSTASMTLFVYSKSEYTIESVSVSVRLHDNSSQLHLIELKFCAHHCLINMPVEFEDENDLSRND